MTENLVSDNYGIHVCVRDSSYFLKTRLTRECGRRDKLINRPNFTALREEESRSVQWRNTT